MRKVNSHLSAKIVCYTDLLDALVRELDTYVDEDFDALRVKLNVAVSALERFKAAHAKWEKEQP